MSLLSLEHEEEYNFWSLTNTIATGLQDVQEPSVGLWAGTCLEPSR